MKGPHFQENWGPRNWSSQFCSYFDFARTFTKELRASSLLGKYCPVEPNPLPESNCFQTPVSVVQAPPPVYLCRSKAGPRLLYYLGEASAAGRTCVSVKAVTDPRAAQQEAIKTRGQDHL